MTCTACHGAAQLFLCRQCQTQLADTLLSLLPTVDNGRPQPGLIEHLEDVELRRTRLGGGAPRNRADGSPALYQPDTDTSTHEKPRRTRQARASDELAALRNSLTTWVRHVCETRGVDFMPAHSVGHAFIGPLLPGWRRLARDYSPETAELAAWLAARTDAIALDEAAGEMFADITEHHATIMRLIDKPLGRKFLGKCPTWNDRARRTCGRELEAREDAIEITCPRCRQTHNCNRLQYLMSTDRAREKYTVRQILALNRDLPEEYRVSERTLRRWRQPWKGRPPRLKPRGWIRPDGSHGINQRNPDDEPLYLYADIERLRGEGQKAG